jgi:hypothetical protein
MEGSLVADGPPRARHAGDASGFVDTVPQPLVPRDLGEPLASDHDEPRPGLRPRPEDHEQALSVLETCCVVLPGDGREVACRALLTTSGTLPPASDRGGLAARHDSDSVSPKPCSAAPTWVGAGRVSRGILRRGEVDPGSEATAGLVDHVAWPRRVLARGVMELHLLAM